jgi:hypothetical protein
MRLEDLQRSISATVLACATTPAPDLIAGRADPAKRLRIHANNTAQSLTDALKANFPVTLTLLGERFFEQTARSFLREHPPREPRLVHYGEGFPRFIARLPAGRNMPFIARVALLESLILESVCSPVHAPITPSDLPSPMAHSDVFMDVQPSLRLMRSRFDAVAIWRAHRDGSTLAPALGEAGHQFVQVVRTGNTIRLSTLSAAEFAFRQALLIRRPLHLAADAAFVADKAFELVSGIARLLAEGLVHAATTCADDHHGA